MSPQQPNPNWYILSLFPSLYYVVFVRFGLPPPRICGTASSLVLINFHLNNSAIVVTTAAVDADTSIVTLRVRVIAVAYCTSHIPLLLWLNQTAHAKQNEPSIPLSYDKLQY